MKQVIRAARKAGVTIAGFTIIIVGVILLILPGPGILVILLGLAVLSLEFEWAERHMQLIKSKSRKTLDKVRKN